MRYPTIVRHKESRDRAAASFAPAVERRAAPRWQTRCRSRSDNLWYRGWTCNDQPIRAPWRLSSFGTRPTSRRSKDSPVCSDTAAATPAPWPLTAQHIILRVAACEILSPPMQRPATIRPAIPLGTSERYGTCLLYTSDAADE